MHTQNSPERNPLLRFRDWLAGDATRFPANPEDRSATRPTAELVKSEDEKTLEAPGGLETGITEVQSMSEPMDEFGYVFDIKRTTFS